MTDQEIPTVESALLSMLKEDNKVIAYRPRISRLVGTTSTILLQQMYYRYNGKPFYKLKKPCSLPQYKIGDSWCEELGFLPGEFDTALRHISTKCTKGKSKAELMGTCPDIPPPVSTETKKQYMKRLGVVLKYLIIFWTDSSHVTWYHFNQELFAKLLIAIYIEKLDCAIHGLNGESQFIFVIDSKNTIKETTLSEASSDDASNDDERIWSEIMESDRDGIILQCDGCKRDIIVGSKYWKNLDTLEYLCDECHQSKQPTVSIDDDNTIYYGSADDPTDNQLRNKMDCPHCSKAVFAGVDCIQDDCPHCGKLIIIDASKCAVCGGGCEYKGDGSYFNYQYGIISICDSCSTWLEDDDCDGYPAMRHGYQRVTGKPSLSMINCNDCIGVICDNEQASDYWINADDRVLCASCHGKLDDNQLFDNLGQLTDEQAQNNHKRKNDGDRHPLVEDAIMSTLGQLANPSMAAVNISINFRVWNELVKRGWAIEYTPYDGVMDLSLSATDTGRAALEAYKLRQGRAILQKHFDNHHTLTDEQALVLEVIDDIDNHATVDAQVWAKLNAIDYIKPNPAIEPDDAVFAFDVLTNKGRAALEVYKAQQSKVADLKAKDCSVSERCESQQVEEPEQHICPKCGEKMLLTYGDDDVESSGYYVCEDCPPEIEPVQPPDDSLADDKSNFYHNRIPLGVDVRVLAIAYYHEKIYADAPSKIMTTNIRDIDMLVGGGVIRQKYGYYVVTALGKKVCEEAMQNPNNQLRDAILMQRDKQPPKAKGKRKPTYHQMLFGAISDALPGNPDERTTPDKKLIGKAVKELKLVNAQPEEMAMLFYYCNDRYDNPGAMCMVKYYSAFKASDEYKQLQAHLETPPTEPEPDVIDGEEPTEAEKAEAAQLLKELLDK